MEKLSSTSNAKSPSNQLWLLFLILWSALNLLQAALTQLDPDEAYYWMYSRQLDWGYFDHPPIIALLIRIGTVLLPGELSVRLGVVALQTLSFQGIWLLVGKPQDRASVVLLILLLAAMPMLQVYGFIATPDAPLLFFTVYFFLLYQRFLQRASWTNTLLLGACMAALLYSKYHGVLVIFFTLLSNWRLLTQPHFYVASVFGALLFFPHLYWQYVHDFPSFRYHLLGRDDPYELKHTATYLLNQFLIFNPLLFPFIVWTLLRKPIANCVERAFYFVIFGFWLFFLYATSKGHVEPQWTVVLSIPFVILKWRYAVQGANFIFTKRIKWAAGFSIGLLLLARIALLKWNVFHLESNFHRNAWIAELQKQANGLPVVFQNSYRDPSMYAFYCGELAYTFTDAQYRKNQFDLWAWEKRLHNRRVAIVGKPDWNCTDGQALELTDKRFTLKIADSLQIAQKVVFDFKIPSNIRVGETTAMPVQIINPYAHRIRFGFGNMPLRVVAVFYLPAEESIAAVAGIQWRRPLIELPPQDTVATNGIWTTPSLPPGKYLLALGIQTGELPPAFNSTFYKVQIN